MELSLSPGEVSTGMMASGKPCSVGEAARGDC